MKFSFNNPQDSMLDNVLDEIDSPEEQDADESQDENLSEVEERLELAHCYRMLIKQGALFSTQNRITRVVEKEVRDFIVTRLEQLMGVSSSTKVETQSQFSPEEAGVLKQLAHKVLANASTPAVRTQPAPTSEVRVNTVKSEPQPPKQQPRAPPAKKKQPSSKQKAIRYERSGQKNAQGEEIIMAIPNTAAIQDGPIKPLEMPSPDQMARISAMQTAAGMRPVSSPYSSELTDQSVTPQMAAHMAALVSRSKG